MERAEELPDELWRRVLELGIENGTLSYKDLCSLSISSHRLRRLSSDHSLWNRLISSHFPQPLPLPRPPPPPKSLFQLRFERDKEKRIAAHRRALLRKQSQISEHSRRLRDIRSRLDQESLSSRNISRQLSNLRRVRQASVALNVWQPEVVRSRQMQMVEQCVVPAESRIHSLEMELRLCRQQIMGLEQSYKDEKHRLDSAKEELASMTYHPLREHKPVSGGESDRSNIKRKKLKSCHS